MFDTSRPRLKVSREGMVLIKSFEGFRPRAAEEESGRWVIGYGHTASAREGLTVGEQDAELLLQYDLLPVVKALNEQVSAPLNQHQFDALASFVMSVGVERFLASDVLRKLNEGRTSEAAEALIGWPEPPAPDAALRRRAAERALFVAEAGAPVLLADLLAAPLPSPPVETPPTMAEPGQGAEAAGPLADEPAPPPPAAATPPVIPNFAGWAPQEPAFAKPKTATVHMHRFAPYAGVEAGPLPGLPAAAPATEGTNGPDEAVVPPAAAIPEPPAPPSVEPGVPPAVVTPPADEPLVLTPASEADFVEAERRPWATEERVFETPPADAGLFPDEAPLFVLRHEAEPAAPRRFLRGGSGAFLAMGLVGLAACAFSAAAFRRGLTENTTDFTLIGGVLALIGVICVGVASWSLYVRWARGA